ncbi:MAG: aldo/keto reductase [Mangrovibacterium sp.]
MKDKKNINRKDFLKVLGSVAATSATLAYGCKPKNQTVLTEGALSLSDISPEKMEYRVNPNTGDKVSLLGYGCMRLPVRKISETEEEIDQDTWNDLVDIAIEKGVNYFDTAPVYGRGLSERTTGIALSRHPRDKFFIATKMSTHRPGDRSREASVAMYHNSFKELQVDYIDYYLLHAVGLGNGMQDFSNRFIDNGVLDFLLKEREAGRIRNLGWSFHGDVKVFDQLLAMDVKWDFVQIQLNYVDWEHASGWNVNAEYLYNELAKRNIPAVIMEPLLGGRLAKIPTFIAGKLKQQRPEESIASWAFRYAGSPSDVLTVLSGMTYKEHLVDNLHTYSPLVPVTDKEKELLEEVAQMILQYPLIACTECDYCMPCPYGIDIPGIFVHYNRCINEGNYPKSRQDENYKKARRAFLIGYDRTVPKLRQANHCIHCGKCEPLCPQRIHITDEMDRINKFVEQLKQRTLP